MIEIPSNALLEDISPCYNQQTMPLSWRQPRTVPSGCWLRVVVKEGSISLSKEGSPPYWLASDSMSILKEDEVFHFEAVEYCRFYIEYYRQRALRAPFVLSRSV